MKWPALFTLVVASCALAASGAVSRSAPAYDYKFVWDASLGKPGFNDYVTFDPMGRRLYIAHLNQVTIFDPSVNQVIGSVGPFKEAHGVAVVAALHKAFASDGGAGVLTIIDIDNLQVAGEIKIADDVDGIIFDPATGMILAVAGDAKSLNVVDPRSDRVKTVALPGQPEFLATDLKGSVFVNIVDPAIVARVNIAMGRVEARWPLSGCEKPHGLAYDSKSNRLFSSCANGRLVVLDASTGANLANLRIGQGSDAVVVDAARGLVFSSNADGTLDIIREGPGNEYRVVRTIPTFFGGRTMAIDPTRGTIFVAHGNTVLVGGVNDKSALRFGWDGVNIARFDPMP